jgi:hypothetical protein
VIHDRRLKVAKCTVHALAVEEIELLPGGKAGKLRRH